MSSSIIIVSKCNGFVIVLVGYRAIVNPHTENYKYPLPRNEELVWFKNFYGI